MDIQTLLRDYRRAVKDDPAPLLALFAEEAARAEVAERLVTDLEAQLAAQQWRPVTEKPLVAMQYQIVVQHSRQQPAADHMAYYPSSGWTGTDVIYWRPIPPLPPLPDAAEEPTP